MKSKIKKCISSSVENFTRIFDDQDILDQIERIVLLCIERYKSDNKILFCGNGGSAADAQHIAAELTGRFYLNRSPLYAEALHVNSSYMTAVANDEGKLVSNGAFLALTGSRTGRSPKDRFIVEEASTRDQIEWGNVNQPFNSDDFNNLWDKVSDYLSNKKHYKTEVHVGSNKDHYIPVEVKCEKAWHSLFSKLIFIVPDKYNSENKEVWQLISAPNFVCDPEEEITVSGASLGLFKSIPASLISLAL